MVFKVKKGTPTSVVDEETGEMYSGQFDILKDAPLEKVWSKLKKIIVGK